MTALEIRDARGSELVAGCELLAACMGFSERDALPPWLVQTVAQHGGVALGAFVNQRLIGFSAAVPTSADVLFSCGLAVAPEFRGRRVGHQLKIEQRARALAQGCHSILWTADPLSRAALALYLSGLGARIVDYGAELYGAVRPAAVPADDVIVEWRLDGEWAAGPAAGCVEVPFDHRSLDRNLLLCWRLRVRRAMQRVLDRGAVGTRVAVDRAARRAWVLFNETA